MRHRDSWILPSLLGAGVGLVVGWVLTRPRPEPTRAAGESDRDVSWGDRWGDRVDAAVDAAAGGFRAVERRWRAPRPLAIGPLRATLEDIPGADRLRVSVLGEGLVEIEGEGSAEVVAHARARLLEQEGVRVVLNRVWTPSSAEPATN